MSFIKSLFLYIIVISDFLEAAHEVAIMAIFRNEAPYLKEWIEFHLMVGVNHFYLANHFSEDHYLEVLQPYIEEGLVDLINLKEDFDKNDPKKWFRWNSIQSRCFTNILLKNSNNVRWMIALDLDEYIVPYECDTLQEFLKDYEEFGGVSIFWKNYGTSFVEKIPEGELLIESLTLRADDTYDWNCYFKTFVQPSKVLYYSQPHWPTFKKGYYSVNANKEIVKKSPEDFFCYDKIAIHHFWTKDEEFFKKVKLPRRADWNQIEEIFKRKDKCNSVEDLLIFRFVDDLKVLIKGKDDYSYTG